MSGKRIKKVKDKLVSHPDNDGFGYAAMTSEGNIYGERWLNVVDALKDRYKLSGEFEDKLKKTFGDAIKLETESNAEKYNTFGDFSKENISKTTSIILHARNKTKGDKNIENTHPFYCGDKEDVHDIALIHNGTIRNHEDIPKRHSDYSTCDSEVILNQYLDYGINFEASNIESLADDFIGEYACLVLTKSSVNNKEVPIVDVFKSEKPLYMAFIKEYGCVVFCTMKHIIVDVAKDCNLTVIGISEFQDGNLLRFNAVTGQLMQKPVKFEPSERHTKTSTYSGYNGNYNSGRSTKSTTTTPALPNNSGNGNVSKLPLNAKKDEELEQQKMDFENDFLGNTIYTVGNMDKDTKEILEGLEKIENNGVGVKAIELVRHALVSNMKG